MAKSVDQIAKLLELKPEDVYRYPIPLINSMVAARVSNLKESRYRAEKYGEIDSYTEKDFTGLKAITTVLNQMFSNSGSTDNNKPKGAKNLSNMNQ